MKRTLCTIVLLSLTMTTNVIAQPLGERCYTPPLPLQPRLENRSFPSGFSAWGGLGWSPIINQPHMTDLEQMSQHDLYFCCLMFEQEFFYTGTDWEVRAIDWWWSPDPTSVRDDYLAHNPNMIFLAGLSAVWEKLDTFPKDSDYWLRDDEGKILPAWTSGLVDLNHPHVQKRIIDRAVAVSECGLYDGIFFDGWSEYHANYYGTIKGAEAILKGIRERVRDDFLIMVNTNTSTAPVSAPYVNGIYMESGAPYSNMQHGGIENVETAFREIEDTLIWAEANLRSPQINGLAGEGFPNDAIDDDVQNLPWVRALTTLVLTLSDGYIYYSHLSKGKFKRFWYDFWDADLGRPVGETLQLYDNRPGLYNREFTNGWAVYNHSGEAQIVTLPEEVQSVTSGLINTEQAVLNLDGDIFLNMPPVVPGDINGDGIVNILDLTLVAQALGTDSRQGDVNADGVVNVFDLVFVAEQF